VKHFFGLLLLLCSLGAHGQAYDIFYPGGALSGTWNSQNVNLGAGAPFIANPGSLTANPSCTIGLTAVNGTATTYARSDASCLLSQAIAPTWTGAHTFSNENNTIILSAGTPAITWSESDAAANNKRWQAFPTSEQFVFRIQNDALSAAVNWLTVDRTATVVDTVHFPTVGVNAFRAGATLPISYSTIASINSNSSSFGTLAVRNGTAANYTLVLANEDTSGNNLLAEFYTDAATSRGSISFNRGAGLIVYATTSSGLRKDNIRDSGPAGQIIDAIKVRDYEFRDSGQTVRHWLVAEEVADVAPLASDGAQVDASKLVPLIVKELQSLRLRVADLETQLFRERSAANEDRFTPEESAGPRFHRSAGGSVGGIERVRRPD
jgi:hypothetical protein